jgi:hypothetical protein
MSEIRLIAVPGAALVGEPGSRLALLQVLVVPRLDPAPSVAQTAMHDWAARVGSLRLVVETTPDAASAAHPVTSTLASTPDDAVWRAFFATTPRSLAVEAPNLPSFSQPEVAPTADRARRLSGGYATSARQIASAGSGSAAAQQAVAGTLADFRGELGPTPAQVTGTAMQLPAFHGFVAMLREHPQVLRKLGLILDLHLPPGELPKTSAGPRLVHVLAPDLGPVARSPWTRYEYDGSTFLPAAGTLHRGGRVDLTGAPLLDGSLPDAAAWAVSTVDVDDAVRRLQAAAAAPGGAPALPPLRTAGLALVHRRRSAAFAARSARAAPTADVSTVELDADQLVLGYRVDVRQQGVGWRSLHERHATYHVDHTPIGPAGQSEEGHLKPFAAVRHGDHGGLLGDEVVARWSGWSLAVRPPELLPSAARASGVRAAELPFTFTFDYDVPAGSLPSLRFGHGYQLRIRVADAAGGGLRLADVTADAGATEQVVYLRLEPVPPPTVVVPGALGAGATALTLVIRSDPGANLGVAAFAPGAAGVGVADARRTLETPTTTWELAEQHGVLDHDDAATWELAKRALAQGRVRADGGVAGLVDPASGGLVACALPAPGGLTAPLTDDRAWAGNWPDRTAKAVELVAAPAGAAPSFRFTTDDLLSVQLAPAAEVVIELSSFIDADLRAQFEARRWLHDFPDADADFGGGRHPMATPPEAVRFVHAVRRPLRPVGGALTPRPAAPGQTFARLAAGLDVDAASIGRVEVTASWREPVDDPAAERPSTREVSAAAVGALTVERGQTAFPDLRHELGDTRHRRIGYATLAISRFRQFFDTGDLDAAFRLPSTLAAVDLPSTAAPPAPVVLAAVPAFAWEGRRDAVAVGTTTRVRRGNRLRVELARPWFTTGEGEQLGVLVAADPTAVGSAAEPFLSWAARDPILRTRTPGRWLGAARLGGAAGGAVRVALPEAGEGATALLVPFDVTFADGRWFADVEIGLDPPGVYSPMAQLAVVRYQRQSIDGMERSPIVRTDIVNLLPDRTLTVQRTADAVQLRLDGAGPDADTPNRVEAFLELSFGAAPEALTALAADGPAQGGAWGRVPSLAASGGLGDLLGPFDVSELIRSRLFVREVESVASDAAAAGGVHGELGHRIVFADQLVTG